MSSKRRADGSGLMQPRLAVVMDVSPAAALPSSYIRCGGSDLLLAVRPRSPLRPCDGDWLALPLISLMEKGIPQRN
ncbi:MAG: hypothetical protein DYH03_15445 [Nitrospira sp. NTP1]|nr:hypothetical protein [Nitrospira sp. NTP1]